MLTRTLTLHAHGSWMPDHRKGYVHTTRGLQPTDQAMADAYRRKQWRPTVVFDDMVQQAILDILNDAARHLAARVRGIATDPTHFHLVFDVPAGREATGVARSLRYALSFNLNRRFGKRKWFTHKGWVSAVGDEKHLAYMVETYLPRHVGWKWSPERGAWK